ncbi:ribosome hibernation-promoting factor, HPF/YfiA family [Sodalis-like endosymbiont of Proechinophthirus fluctus]|uniref:ribosome hibernation-promoting factor, HPF/YfiA family n=1 Tax=Sodalis-like endosymbiont of Proechinophthirus fluctus TaxID=1462730 RepID=UPI001FCB4B85|nr:ribosome-associated translation inhibitor RaiA [Sodalis-like endosymbiont of Proechinophthirus fluctus]
MTHTLREFVTAKLSKLEQFFEIASISVYIVQKVEKVQKIVEATVHLYGSELHATAEADDVYLAIDLLIDKLTQQLKTHKKKMKQY